MVKRYDSTQDTWLDVPTQYNPDTGVVTAHISHFCCFALFSKAVTPVASVTARSMQLAPQEVAPPPPTAMTTFLGMVLWLVVLILKNPVFFLGIVILAFAIFLYGRKRRRDRVIFRT